MPKIKPETLSSTVILGDIPRMNVGEFGTMAGAALLAAVNQEHRGDVTIRREFSPACETAEMCIRLDGEDVY